MRRLIHRGKELVRFPEQSDDLLDKLRARLDAYQGRVHLDDWPSEKLLTRMGRMIRTIEWAGFPSILQRFHDAWAAADAGRWWYFTS